MRDPEAVPRLPAVAGELFEAGDLALAFDPRRMVGRQWLDQAADAVADLQGEMGGDGAGEGADVLDRDLLLAAEQLWVIRRAHSSSPIFASSASSLTSACWPTAIASWSPITQTWL